MGTVAGSGPARSLVRSSKRCTKAGSFSDHRCYKDASTSFHGRVVADVEVTLIGFGFFCVVTIAAYTANLATILVAHKKVAAVESPTDCRAAQRLCVDTMGGGRDIGSDALWCQDSVSGTSRCILVVSPAYTC